MKRETRAIWIPLWTGSHLGKVGCSASHTPPCSAAHAHPVCLSLHLPACGGTHCIHLTVSGPRNTPIPPGMVTGTVFPQSSSISSRPESTAAAHPTAGGQRGSSINEDFNDGYRLVLQASESHLNSGNFKLFWQYKRA